MNGEALKKKTIILKTIFLMYKQDKITKEWHEYEWICEDTGENPIKKGYLIETIGKKQWATDKTGKKYKIVLVNLTTGEVINPMEIF